MNYTEFNKGDLDFLLHTYGWSYNDFDNDKKAHLIVSKSTLQRAKREGRMTVNTYNRLLNFLVENKREYIDGRKRNYLKRLKEKRNDNGCK